MTDIVGTPRFSSAGVADLSPPPMRRHRSPPEGLDTRLEGRCSGSGSGTSGVGSWSGRTRRRASECADWGPIVLYWGFIAALLAAPVADAQSSDGYSSNRTALNREIYLDAFASLNSIRVRTAVIYNATLPSNLTDNSVELVQMARLRSGSLRRYGFQFNEISLPPGVRVVQAVRSVVLVYRRFREYSFYNTSGKEFVAPVVGILLYDAADLANYTGAVRTELDVVAGQQPILVRWTQPNETDPEVDCVLYDNTVNGTAQGTVANLTSASTCQWTTLGDFSLVGPRSEGKSNRWKIILGSVLGGVGLLFLLALTGFLAYRYQDRAKFAKMRSKSEEGDPLEETFIGSSKIATAPSTRTKSTLQAEDVR